MSHVTTLLMATTDTDLNHNYHRNLSLRLLVAALVLGLASVGCRVKSPSIEEQRALVEKGAFPRGVPAWSSGALQVANSAGRQAPGLIPNEFNRSSLPGSLNRPTVNRTAEQERAALNNDGADSVLGEQNVAVRETKAQSELGRIEALCPGIEKDVTTALTTVESDDRIRRYRRLTSRCPESHDIWLWLAKDFYGAGRMAEAERAANRVLSLDPGNSGASALITNIRQSR